MKIKTRNDKDMSSNERRHWLELFNTVNYYLNNVIAKTLIKVKHRHEKKLVTLVQQKRNLYGESNTVYSFYYIQLLIIQSISR